VSQKDSRLRGKVLQFGNGISLCRRKFFDIGPSRFEISDLLGRQAAVSLFNFLPADAKMLSAAAVKFFIVFSQRAVAVLQNAVDDFFHALAKPAIVFCCSFFRFFYRPHDPPRFSVITY